jgi:hypothetical protein
MPLLPPVPHESQLVTSISDPQSGKERLTGYISEEFLNWLHTLTGRVNTNPQRLVNLRIPTAAGAAAIATTSLPVPSLVPGLYRVSYYARITQPATTSSSLIVTIGHTDDGESCVQAGPAITGNTAATVQSGTFLMRIDGSTAITYATTYASVGGTPMTYSLEIVVEALPA